MSVSYERRGETGIIAVDNPPVNAVAHAVRQGLLATLAEAETDTAAKAIVLYCEGRTFVAGADIKEFGKPQLLPNLGQVIAAFDDCTKPIIAALHGTALGGGLELALGCHYRVALASAKLGLPEVTLGIIPGAGGTQRVPRLAGVEAALEMITSGRFLAAKEAAALNLVDEVADGDNALEAGLSFARRVIDEAMPLRRVRDMACAAPDADTFNNFRAGLQKKLPQLFSPFKCVDAVEAAAKLAFDEGVTRERELFQQCMDSPQRSGLIHAFFSEREAGKVPELKTGSARDVKSVGVIGGGTMGAGITVALLLAGFSVTMIERDADSAERGRSNVADILEGSVKRGKMSGEKRSDILANRFGAETDYAALGGADLIIEAVFEDMGVKKMVFGLLDKAAKPGAVLASNTSYLDIDEIAAVTTRPEDVIGMHFFSPAHIMKLLEIVVAGKTSADVVATAFGIAKRTGKVGVRAGLCDGFIGNRILHAYRKQADYLVLDGASPWEVDAAMVEFGMPMGVFQMMDLAGLDIGWADRKRRDKSRDPRERVANFANAVCELGRFGQKTGRGFYIYENGDRRGKPDPEVDGIIKKERAAAGINARRFSHGEIVSRWMAAMINEAAKVVEEGIAARPLDVDVTMLYGYGFPRWRGGPMHYADTIGLDKILNDIKAYAKEDDFTWQPAKLLVELAESGKSFATLNNRA